MKKICYSQGESAEKFPGGWVSEVGQWKKKRPKNSKTLPGGGRGGQRKKDRK